MAAEAADWEKLTPERLIPAVGHIRKAFDTGIWNSSEITKYFCYVALHPQGPPPSPLRSFEPAFDNYRKIVGPAATRQFDDLAKMRTLPSLFRAYLDLFRSGCEIAVRDEFDQILRIGLANVSALKIHPVEWAKLHLQLLIRGSAHLVSSWIKQVCDQQDYSKALEKPPDIEEVIYWTSWRAPRLIHMQPSGNTPYDAPTAWAREGEATTRQLLDSLSQHFIEFVQIYLDEVFGKPNRAWAMLRILAEHDGIIRDGRQTQSAWSVVEKRIQEIRKLLQKHFGISSAPVPFIEGTGYQTRFKIGCKQSFDS
jgi:hypothetical protein